MREMYLTDFHTVTITAIVQKQGERQNYILSLGMLDIEFPKKIKSKTYKRQFPLCTLGHPEGT